MPRQRSSHQPPPHLDATFNHKPPLLTPHSTFPVRKCPFSPPDSGSSHCAQHRITSSRSTLRRLYFSEAFGCVSLGVTYNPGPLPTDASWPVNSSLSSLVPFSLASHSSVVCGSVSVWCLECTREGEGVDGGSNTVVCWEAGTWVQPRQKVTSPQLMFCFVPSS